MDMCLMFVRQICVSWINDFPFWEVLVTAIVTAAVTWVTIVAATRSAREATRKTLEQAAKLHDTQMRVRAAAVLRAATEAELHAFDAIGDHDEAGVASHLGIYMARHDEAEVLLAPFEDGRKLLDLVRALTLEYLKPDITEFEAWYTDGTIRGIRAARREQINTCITAWARGEPNEWLTELLNNALLRMTVAERSFEGWLREASRGARRQWPLPIRLTRNLKSIWSEFVMRISHQRRTPRP